MSRMGGKPAEKFLGVEVLKGTTYNIEMKHAASVLHLTSLEKCMSITFTGSSNTRTFPRRDVCIYCPRQKIPEVKNKANTTNIKYTTRCLKHILLHSDVQSIFYCILHKSVLDMLTSIHTGPFPINFPYSNILRQKIKTDLYQIHTSVM
jgi:hypothetical protein